MIQFNFSFLRWNRESRALLLSIMKAIFEEINFLTPNRARLNFKRGFAKGSQCRKTLKFWETCFYTNWNDIFLVQNYCKKKLKIGTPYCLYLTINWRHWTLNKVQQVARIMDGTIYRAILKYKTTSISCHVKPKRSVLYPRYEIFYI